MPDANALNFLALQDAVLGRRFPAASQRNNAKRWLATAYQDVWSADDWTFKRVSRANFVMSAGSSKPTMPSDFGDAIEIFDTFGTPLIRLSQKNFEEQYADILVQSQVGLPEAYTVTDRQVEVAPLPLGGTYKLSYYRRLSHKTLDGVTVVAGFFTDDSDFPLWNDHHSLLIPRATSIGLTEINDPTWDLAQEEYERQLSRMKEDYTYQYPAKQWGAVSWDA